MLLQRRAPTASAEPSLAHPPVARPPPMPGNDTRTTPAGCSGTPSPRDPFPHSAPAPRVRHERHFGAALDWRAHGFANLHDLLSVLPSLRLETHGARPRPHHSRPPAPPLTPPAPCPRPTDAPQARGCSSVSTSGAARRSRRAATGPSGREMARPVTTRARVRSAGGSGGSTGWRTGISAIAPPMSVADLATRSAARMREGATGGRVGPGEFRYRFLVGADVPQFSRRQGAV